jgi:hypothetical protein
MVEGEGEGGREHGREMSWRRSLLVLAGGRSTADYSVMARRYKDV